MSSKDAPQKMHFFWYFEKAGMSVPVAPKRKLAENLHRIDCLWPKAGLNPIFLGYSNSPWTEPNMHTRFYMRNESWVKVPASPKSPTGYSEKQEDPENNSYRLTMHFRTNYFIFKARKISTSTSIVTPQLISFGQENNMFGVIYNNVLEDRDISSPRRTNSLV